MPKPMPESDKAERATRSRKVVDGCLGRHGGDESLDYEQVVAAHPDLMPELGEELRKLQVIEQARQSANSAGADGRSGAETRRDALPPGPPPDSLPGYEIVRRIHHGGQGVVYQAVQQSTKRKVAIKVMREGPFAGPHDRARFEREVEILGALHHPHIVTIHASGTAAGHFYYVMDYISGHALDVYMASNGWSIDETLRLFEKICGAVNAAHLRGVTHRDLKPSNIRIDGEGEPHILDFGLAKIATDSETDDRASQMMTVTGQFVGSLPWSSPEQAEGLPGRIDLRTDVYSLGVVFYQMLTGRFPYTVVGPVREVMDNIIEAEPTKPSTIRREINDEVETIVLKCLSKAPERRYQSAGELAGDIHRYLTGRPIEAKRDSTWYVFRKTVRRYKLTVAVAATVAGLVIAFALAMSVMYRRANAEAETANRVLGCLESLLKQFDPSARPREEVSVRGILDRGAERVAEELQDQPEAQARLMEIVATAYEGLGLHDQAIEWWRNVLALRRDALGDDDHTVAVSLLRLARTLGMAGYFEEAEARYQEALNAARRGNSRPNAATMEILSLYGGFLQNKGDYGAARAPLEEASKMARVLHPGDHWTVVNTHRSVGGLLHDIGEYEAAETYYREALAMSRRLAPSDHPRAAGAMEQLGLLLKDMKEYAAAEPLIRESLEMRLRLLGERSVPVAQTYLSLAKLRTDAGDWQAAETTCRKALELHTKVLGADHRHTARAMTLLGRILVEQDRAAEAEPLLREALEIRRKRKPLGHWKTAKTQSILGAALTGLARYDEAEPLLLESYPVIAQDRGPRHRRTLEALQRIIDLYHAWGRSDEATDWQAKLPSSD
ncbi:MAG: serine/threonine-protein kinase [Planctomycetota bacterium]|jgi:tetratricopeptide (TPR) repeat protein